jgi:hypothetical protein
MEDEQAGGDRAHGGDQLLAAALAREVAMRARNERFEGRFLRPLGTEDQRDELSPIAEELFELFERLTVAARLIEQQEIWGRCLDRCR